MRNGSIFCLLVVLLAYGLGPALMLKAETPWIAVVKGKGIQEHDRVQKGIVEALEKQKIIAEYSIFYFPRGKIDEARLNETIISPILSQKPRLVITIGQYATRYVFKRISGIPIIFSMVMNPEEAGIGQSLRGALADIHPEDRLRVLAQVFPAMKRIGIIYNPPQNGEYVERAKKCAQYQGFHFTAFPVSSPRDIPPIEGMEIDVLWVIPDTVVFSNRTIYRRLIVTSVQNRVALLAWSSYFTKAGALLSITCDFKDIGRQTGEMAARFIKGKKYKDLVNTFPRRVSLYFNQAVADRLKIQIPPDYLKKADFVFGK